MGKQFSVALAEFNQEQLNQIQVAVDTVQDAVGDVGSIVSDIKNTDVAGLANKVDNIRNTDVPGINANINTVSGKVDIIKNKIIENRTLMYALNTSTSDGSSTVFEVTSGSGYLLFINTSHSSNLSCHVQIDNNVNRQVINVGPYACVWLLMRFNTQIKVTFYGSAGLMRAVYCLD